jgi:hypothetical protein
VRCSRQEASGHIRQMTSGCTCDEKAFEAVSHSQSLSSRLLRATTIHQDHTSASFPPLPSRQDLFSLSSSLLPEPALSRTRNLDVHPRKVVVNLPSLQDGVEPSDVLLELRVDVRRVRRVELEEAGVFGSVAGGVVRVGRAAVDFLALRGAAAGGAVVGEISGGATGGRRWQRRKTHSD